MSRTLAIVFVVVVAGKAAYSPAKHTVYPEYTEAGRDVWKDEPRGYVAQQYLPYFSLAMTGFAALPDQVGCPLWAVLSLTVYLTGLRALHRSFLPRETWPAFLLAGLSVGLSSLWNQQANAVIAGMLMWGVAMARRGRYTLAAVCLGLPAFKLYPLALGMVLCTIHPRLTVRLALVVAALVLVPFAVLGPAVAAERYVWIAEYAAEGVHAWRFNLVGVRDLMERHGLETGLGTFFVVQAVTGALIPLVLWLNPVDVHRRAFVLVSLWFVTFGPSVEGPTYLLAAPALGLLLLEAWRGGHWVAFGFVLGVMLLSGPAQTSLLGLEAQRWLAKAKPACVALTVAWLWTLARAMVPAATPRAAVAFAG